MSFEWNFNGMYSQENLEFENAILVQFGKVRFTQIFAILDSIIDILIIYNMGAKKVETMFLTHVESERSYLQTLLSATYCM